MLSGFELIEHSEPRDGWIQVRCALNNQLVTPFQIHRTDRERYRNDKEYFQMLERQAESLLKTYGDARENRLEPMEA